ncbi:hypothetical protein [Cellulomonas sp. NPDC089187]|uniref:hypothetical protein n=1 Tax=Cellulomonas sp. NPDC089187 TaxID=3154970 RepID=UPI003413B9DB
MERDFDPDEAARALDALAADRAQLVDRARVPWTLMAGFGAAAAWWVGSAAGTEPGAGYRAPASSWLALLGVLVIAHLVRRELGIRFRSMGTRAGGAVTALVIGCLVLFSVSLGLVSLGAAWAVALTSLCAFGLTTWLSGVALRSAVAELRRG